MKFPAAICLWLVAAVCLGGEERHWAYEPLATNGPPEVRLRGWVRNPVDAFVLEKLEGRGMRPSTEASPRQLIRRLYFDLWGLPPSLEEVRAFEREASPAAYENTVNRLLESPRYGERWARHWMDLVHFAETHGHDQDRIRTNAWHYRDYLINSFNADKPYGRFVEEQIAGDVLFPDDPQAVVAMGFLAAGPWDESSLRDIREDTLDRQVARYLDRDDMITTAMSTFASTTVHCARCHNHKFDPVSQEEYYNLQAVFAGVDKADRYFDADPAVHKKRRDLSQLRKQIEKGQVKHERTEEFVAWRNLANQWQVPEIVKVSSESNGVFEVRRDRSVLAKGNRAEKDSYAIELDITENVSAIRLELLADESLPHKGPGRQDNGNLHLSEVEIYRDGKRIEINSAEADFNQKGWTIEHALDGNVKTAWGIYPQVGVSHQAVFRLAEAQPGGTYRMVLKQLHGGGHLIGAFRIATHESGEGATILPAELSNKDEEAALRFYAVRKLDKEIEKLPKPSRVYAAASDFPPDGSHVPAGKPREVRLLRRGEITKAGEVAEPGALACVKGLSAELAITNEQDEGERRAGLAKWLTSGKNALVWRSIVNRVWQQRFWRGIVDTPNDFGKMGGVPSHPELLDWLVLEFQRTGGSLKQLDKLLVMSATYRQSSADKGTYAELDADNKYLWKMTRRRLDAESYRDAVLSISGDIDLAVGGESVKNFGLKPGIHVTPEVDYDKYEFGLPGFGRRSIYRFLFRTVPDPFMDNLDCPDGSTLTPVRNVSVTPLQALALWNNAFVLHQAKRIAVQNSSAEEYFQRILQRYPSASEKKKIEEYKKRHGAASLCRVLLNSNEFLFVD